MLTLNKIYLEKKQHKPTDLLWSDPVLLEKMSKTLSWRGENLWRVI